MEEQKIKKIMKTYNEFKNNLSKNINSNKKPLFTQQSEDCYLIDEVWINELKKRFNQYNNNKNNRNIKNNIPFTNFSPKFITDFSNIINNINNSKNIRLVNKKLIEYLFNPNDLKNLPIIKYYGGNNKIIIEYKNKNKNDNKALLLINPLDENIMKDNAFIIDIDNKNKLSLYKDLLSEKYNANITSQKYQDFVIPFEQYLQIIINKGNKKHISPQKKNSQNLNNKNKFSSQKININIDKELFKRQILKLLIYIFYHEKNIYNNGISSLKENEYYLINKEWFDKYMNIKNYVYF